VAVGFGVREVLASDAFIPAIAEAVAPLELITQVKPEDFPEQPRPPKNQPKSGGPDKVNKVPERAIQMDRIKDALVIPKAVSAVPSKNKELPPGNVRITGRDVDPSGSGSNAVIAVGSPDGTGEAKKPVVVANLPDPPPLATPTPKPPVSKKSGGVITSQAISLPQPPYPPSAKLMRQQGTVRVQVTVSEYGKITQATAVSGPILLRAVSEQYARLARFTPTYLTSQPVQVTGFIDYNFVLK